jgi:hypothetical protein
VIRNLLVLAVTLALGLLLVESALRVAGATPRNADVNRFFAEGRETTWSVPDAELGWINRPGQSRSVEQGGALMTFWDHGRRASRPDPQRRGRVPVMIIGGSNAQAYGVRDAESFAWLLAEKFPDLWIENFGTGGYGTVQAMLLTERVLGTFYKDVSPRLVLLGFDDSHAMRNVADQSWIMSISDSQGRYVAPPHYRLTGTGEFAFEPFTAIGWWPLERASAAITIVHSAWLREVAYDTGVQAVPVTRWVLSRLAGQLKARGIDFAAVTLENRSGVAEKIFEDAAFPHADCSGPERTEPAQYLLDGGSHPNARLHAHYATCIAALIEERLQIAPSR